MASAAFKSAFFIASLARRNPGQSHPVFTGRTHRPFDIGQRTTHHPTKMETIFISSSGGLSGTRLSRKILVCLAPVFRNHGRLPELACRAFLNGRPARSRPERPYPSVRGRAPIDRRAARKQNDLKILQETTSDNFRLPTFLFVCRRRGRRNRETGLGL
jgi:hypothetical protein